MRLVTLKSPTPPFLPEKGLSMLCPICGGLKRFMLSVSPFTEKSCTRCEGTGVVGKPEKGPSLIVVWRENNVLELRAANDEVLARAKFESSMRRKVFLEMMPLNSADRVGLFAQLFPKTAFALGADAFIGWLKSEWSKGELGNVCR